jgi:hypothetical protein
LAALLAATSCLYFWQQRGGYTTTTTTYLRCSPTRRKFATTTQMLRYFTLLILLRPSCLNGRETGYANLNTKSREKNSGVKNERGLTAYLAKRTSYLCSVTPRLLLLSSIHVLAELSPITQMKIGLRVAIWRYVVPFLQLTMPENK